MAHTNATHRGIKNRVLHCICKWEHSWRKPAAWLAIPTFLPEFFVLHLRADAALRWAAVSWLQGHGKEGFQ